MRQALLVAVGAFFLAAPTGYREPMAEDGFDAPPVLLANSSTEGVPLRVMTYNVGGLPWPVKRDRTRELTAIGDRLAAMRGRDEAPDVVVLQEAFTANARAIAARAGYRHVAYGPQSDEEVPGDPNRPMPDRYRWRGEGLGAWLSSGLVLMSDYPIVGIQRSAYPRNACAGYDCLSNKGVLLARIAVPGIGLPVEIMTTHMNAGSRATRTPALHANEAYVRQMAALDQFLARHADPRLPMIVAADLNLRADKRRISALRNSSTRWRKVAGDGDIPAVVAVCDRPSMPCRPGLGLGSIAGKKRNNDWQLAFASDRVSVRPIAAAIRFMPDPARRVLSDHQAVMVDYRLMALAQPPH